MTIDSKSITIPAWIFSVVLPMLIVAIGYIIGLNTIDAKTQVRVEHLHEEVLELKSTKASDEKVDGVIKTLDTMQGSLDRIEDFIINQ